LVRSSPVKPIALNMARAQARSRPSVMSRLRCFGSIGIKDYDSGTESESGHGFHGFTRIKLNVQNATASSGRDRDSLHFSSVEQRGI
jgi:hypothetical protein